MAVAVVAPAEAAVARVLLHCTALNRGSAPSTPRALVVCKRVFVLMRVVAGLRTINLLRLKHALVEVQLIPVLMALEMAMRKVLTVVVAVQIVAPL